jgi:hypothetical protein
MKDLYTACLAIRDFVYGSHVYDVVYVALFKYDYRGEEADRLRNRQIFIDTELFTLEEVNQMRAYFRENKALLLLAEKHDRIHASDYHWPLAVQMCEGEEGFMQFREHAEHPMKFSLFGSFWVNWETPFKRVLNDKDEHLISQLCENFTEHNIPSELGAVLCGFPECKEEASNICISRYVLGLKGDQGTSRIIFRLPLCSKHSFKGNREMFLQFLGGQAGRGRERGSPYESMFNWNVRS